MQASLWFATSHSAPETPPLRGEQKADVAVIGAGFTGLAAALKLAEGGAAVIVVDAQTPGYGASGRNGGQVIPGLKLDPDTLDRLFGEATTDFAGRTADTVFDLIARHNIDCAARGDGWIQASLKHAHLPMLERRMKAWVARGASAAMLDAAELARATGAEGFVGGWLDRRAGSLHPLNYALGLARAAQRAGARLHGRSPATGLTREGMRWRVRIEDKGAIRADRVLLATNGYTDTLWPGLRATMIPASSFQVATEPLTPDVRATILSGAAAVSDTRRVGNYFRLSPDGRLVMGGRGSFAAPRGPAAYSDIEAALRRFYPALAKTPLSYRWAGRLAITSDHLPHVHELAPGVMAVLGYNGRGVALASALGAAIGRHILDPSQPLPLAPTSPAALPVHGLHPVYGTAAIWYYRVRDALES